MRSETRHLFPTPVYQSYIGRFEEVQKEISTVIKTNFREDSDWKTPTTWGKTHKLSTLNFGDNIVEQFNMETLNKQLDNHIKQYCNNIGFNPTEYTMTSWLTLNGNGSYAHIHNHGDVDISGVYYYQTNGLDGDLFFETPVPSCASSRVFTYFSDRVEYKPDPGKVIILPGWLLHGVKTNETDHKRISLAFNVTFKR